MSITISQKGSFERTLKFLKKVHSLSFYDRLAQYGELGVEALRIATPKDTGKTSESWSYEIHRTPAGVSINWTNSNNNHGVYIAVLIQYGHGTRNGGYVEGIDYINPAMKPIFETIATELWNEVISD